MPTPPKTARAIDNWIMNPPELEEDEAPDPDEPTRCAHPGRRGCGHCDSCLDYADQAYHEMVERNAK